MPSPFNYIAMYNNSLRGGLFLVAALFTACQPSTPRFTALTPDETGLVFRNDITESVENNIMTYQYMYNGAGLATGDLNQDGLPDLFVAGNTVHNQLFINQGNWKFKNITQAAGIQDRTGDWKTGVTMADVNGDGWLDIYICYSGNTPGEGYRRPVISENPRRNNQLFINQGCTPGGIPTFTERSQEFGLDAPGTFSTQAYFFDYDRDGDLDMFLLNHANTFYSSLFNTKKLRRLRHPFFGNKLYRNDNLKFVEVSEAAGIHGSGLNYGLSVAVSDLNGDQWPDLYVTNDYDEQDFCYINQRDGTFREVSHEAFGHLSKYAMGSDAADMNNDGLSDILVVDMLPEDNRRQKLLKGADQYDKYTLAVDSGFHHQNMRNTLQVNRGNNADGIPQFSDLGQIAGIANTDWSWAPLFADFDNDGWKDILITNGYLHDYTNLDFLKYAEGEIRDKASLKTASPEMLALIQKMPSTKISNYAYRNVDGFHFENVTDSWGLGERSISNAAVYADFDLDGDLDLVVNNLNDNLSVYRNETSSQEHHYLRIRLEGEGHNRFGIGARIIITADGHTQYQEVYTGRGYISSVEPVLTVGLGKATRIDSLTVLWPDGRTSVNKNVQANQTIIVQQQSAVKENAYYINQTVHPLLQLDSATGIDFVHHENTFVDFRVQRLIPYQASRWGGKCAVGDVNGDGYDDLYFGGAARQSGKLYIGKADGSFVAAPLQPWEVHGASEDIEALFFDADGDHDQDLYVVSGGNEFGAGDPLYHDRLYINDGRGNFVYFAAALPSGESTSGSCVVSADYDHDGDQDLFVGGKLAAQLYPLIPKSYVLRNDTRDGVVRFTDVTASLNQDISLAGMVSDAVWQDINDDQWPDLILVGEFMPIRIFVNKSGTYFEEETKAFGLEKSNGWWSKIVAVDVDADGDTDFLLGNAGTNLQFRASEDEPLELFVKDINNDGGPDPFLTYYIQGQSYPVATMDEAIDQVRPLRKKFIHYETYADATIQDVMGDDYRNGALHLSIFTLKSSWLENASGKLHLKPLPDAVQVSMLNGFVVDDVDGDQHPEVLCVGNFYPYKVDWGRSDAFAGAWLRFKDGQVQLHYTTEKLGITGDVRDAHQVRSPGKRRIVVSKNNEAPMIYSY